MDKPQQDAAWVVIDTPLTASRLFEFAADTERLFRLNPYLEVQHWENDPRGLAEASRLRLKYLNEMNGVARELTLTVSEFKPGVGYTLNYSEGLKRATEIRVEPARNPADNGATLLIKDCYDTVPEHPADGHAAQLAEVDRSLTPWGMAIRQHILGMARWGWLPLYRVWRERFWLGMPPRSRRISRMLIWVTALEFVGFLCVVSIYWLRT